MPSITIIDHDIAFTLHGSNLRYSFNFFSCIQSGSRLFGFIGAGATLGQLCGSLFAAAMACLGPCVYLFMIILLPYSYYSLEALLFSIFLVVPFCFFCRFTSCFSGSHGTCCTVIKRNQERRLTTS